MLLFTQPTALAVRVSFIGLNAVRSTLDEARQKFYPTQETVNASAITDGFAAPPPTWAQSSRENKALTELSQLFLMKYREAFEQDLLALQQADNRPSSTESTRSSTPDAHYISSTSEPSSPTSSSSSISGTATQQAVENLETKIDIIEKKLAEMEEKHTSALTALEEMVTANRLLKERAQRCCLDCQLKLGLFNAAEQVHEAGIGLADSHDSPTLPSLNALSGTTAPEATTSSPDGLSETVRKDETPCAGHPITGASPHAKFEYISVPLEEGNGLAHVFPFLSNEAADMDPKQADVTPVAESSPRLVEEQIHIDLEEGDGLGHVFPFLSNTARQGEVASEYVIPGGEDSVSVSLESIFVPIEDGEGLQHVFPFLTDGVRDVSETKGGVETTVEAPSDFEHDQIFIELKDGDGLGHVFPFLSGRANGTDEALAATSTIIPAAEANRKNTAFEHEVPSPAGQTAAVNDGAASVGAEIQGNVPGIENHTSVSHEVKDPVDEDEELKFGMTSAELPDGDAYQALLHQSSHSNTERRTFTRMVSFSGPESSEHPDRRFTFTPAPRSNTDPATSRSASFSGSDLSAHSSHPFNFASAYGAQLQTLPDRIPTDPGSVEQTPAWSSDSEANDPKAPGEQASKRTRHSEQASGQLQAKPILRDLLSAALVEETGASPLTARKVEEEALQKDTAQNKKTAKASKTKDKAKKKTKPAILSSKEKRTQNKRKSKGKK